jgi:hypothetical protein
VLGGEGPEDGMNATELVDGGQAEGSSLWLENVGGNEGTEERRRESSFWRRRKPCKGERDFGRGC